MTKVTAAGGVVFKDDEEAQVLLIYRRGIWDLPKGKKEENETIEECARREVFEEVGLREFPRLLKDLGETYHEYERNGQSFGKTTHWFAMTIADKHEVKFKPQVEEGIEEVRWMGVDIALQKVGYENLVKVLQVFKQWHA